MREEDRGVTTKDIEVKMMVIGSDILSMFRGLFPCEYIQDNNADGVPAQDAHIKVLVGYDANFAVSEIERLGALQLLFWKHNL